MATLWEEELGAADVSEVHWSTSTIMAVFMAASLVSAVFFGLGYSFGRGGTPKTGINPAVREIVNATASTLKQTSQKPASQPASRQIATLPAPTPLRTADAGLTAKSDPMRPMLRPAQSAARQPATPALVREHKQTRFLEESHSASQAEKSNASERNHYMVQVGAVGDHKDAQTLVSQLRRRGFHAGIYPAKHDKFLHVQIGPFANMQQAQTMRHHVMASGYRAILKRAS